MGDCCTSCRQTVMYVVHAVKLVGEILVDIKQPAIDSESFPMVRPCRMVRAFCEHIQNVSDDMYLQVRFVNNCHPLARS